MKKGPFYTPETTEYPASPGTCSARTLRLPRAARVASFTGLATLPATELEGTGGCLRPATIHLTPRCVPRTLAGPYRRSFQFLFAMGSSISSMVVNTGVLDGVLDGVWKVLKYVLGLLLLILCICVSFAVLAPIVLSLSKAFAELADTQANEGDVSATCDGISVSSALSAMGTAVTSKKVLLLIPMLALTACALGLRGRGKALPAFMVYVTSLLEDVAAVAFLDDDLDSPTHFSPSTLFLAFLAFPTVGCLLNQWATDRNPTSLVDKVAIYVGLELLQAGLFVYFANCSSAAVGFFAWVFLLQVASAQVAVELPGERPESMVRDIAKQLWMMVLLGWMQASWLVAGVILPNWGDVTMAVVAWIAGATTVLEKETLKETATNLFDWNNWGILEFGPMLLRCSSGITVIVSLPVLIGYTEYFLFAHCARMPVYLPS